NMAPAVASTNFVLQTTATYNPCLRSRTLNQNDLVPNNNRVSMCNPSPRQQQPRDDHLPPKEELRLGVAVSTMQSWDDVRDWKLSIREKTWECAKDLKAIVAEVTKGLDKAADKALELTYWVRPNIRFASTGDRHHFTP